VEAKAGSVIFVPANAKHSLKATKDGDVVFFTVKDTVTASCPLADRSLEQFADEKVLENGLETFGFIRTIGPSTCKTTSARSNA
jgi:oxalate decarboxylase/phosphoglucose isomerase-like protein (cupin superfamily)